MKEIKKRDFSFGKVMEDMKGKELEDRIRKAWEWEMDKLTLVPYIGEIDQKIIYDYKELTALCPVTGIQDLYGVKIDFVPNKYIPELKTLKFYLMGYRDLPISHEHLQAKIYKEFKEQVQPKKLGVELDVMIRGGIKTDIRYDG
tara:strand:- start:127 stop:558 length:432 start_codon:yes stop_codon:yes gene_type:complete